MNDINEEEFELDGDMRMFDKKARDEFNKLSEEKKEKSLKAKSFILYPFELFYNQKKTFEEKEKESLFLIEEHLKKYKRCFVATSFGMDSVVMMHLVIRASKNIGCEIPDMFIHDTLNTFKEEKAYWGVISKLFNIEDKVKKFKPLKDETGKQQTVWTVAEKFGHLPNFRFAAEGNKWKNMKGGGLKKAKRANKGATPKCCHILKKDSTKKLLKSLPENERYDCHFVGTRAEESRIRAMSVLQRCRSYIIKTLFPYHIRTVTPLSYWMKADIYNYYELYNIPKNPAYAAHNMDRMGCASCPAHKYWEIRLLKDPTNEGFGMLKQNFGILKRTEPERLQESCRTLRKYMKKDISKEDLTKKMRERGEMLLEEYEVV